MKKMYWYASCELILVMGPYENEAEAWERLRLNDDESIRQQSLHARNARVWASYSPNEVKECLSARSNIEFSYKDAMR
jgi:hypothetical protein